MAYQDLLVGTTSAGQSTAITCDGTARITLGIYPGVSATTAEAWSERAGCPVYYASGTTKITPLTDCKGRPVVLTAHKPTVHIEQAGSYVVDKGVTAQKVGVWGEDGTTP